MRRDTDRLARERFDLVVVGGGALGCFAAWDAAARGLATALVDRGDFGGGTTSASGRVAHGGLRYLQHLELGSLREAAREQRILTRLAPGLVRPLQFVVPAGKGLPQQLAIRAGAAVWRGISSVLAPVPGVAAPRVADARSVASLDPRLTGVAPYGALVFGDVQLRFPDRLALACAAEAAANGACVANYIEAVGLTVAGGAVAGVRVRDRESGAEFEVGGRAVVNATGAWSTELWDLFGIRPHPVGYSKGVHILLDVEPPPVAVAFQWGEPTRGSIAGGARRLFLSPWEGRTLLGATNAPFRGRPSDCRPEPDEVRQLIDEFDARWPQFGVGTASVAAAYAGLYPVFGTWDAPEGVFAASRDPLVIDHGTRDDVQGLLSAVSVKFTTARALAERAVDWATKFIGRGDKSRTRDRSEPLALASIPDPSTYDAAAATSAARDEMALTLADVVFRRTTLGLRGDPGRTLLRELARGMAGPLGWEDARVDAEVASVAAAYDAVRPMAGAAPSHDV